MIKDLYHTAQVRLCGVFLPLTHDILPVTETVFTKFTKCGIIQSQPREVTSFEYPI